MKYILSFMLLVSQMAGASSGECDAVYDKNIQQLQTQTAKLQDEVSNLKAENQRLKAQIKQLQAQNKQYADKLDHAKRDTDNLLQIAEACSKM